MNFKQTIKCAVSILFATVNTMAKWTQTIAHSAPVSPIPLCRCQWADHSEQMHLDVLYVFDLFAFAKNSIKPEMAMKRQ